MIDVVVVIREIEPVRSCIGVCAPIVRQVHNASDVCLSLANQHFCFTKLDMLATYMSEYQENTPKCLML